MNYRRWDEEAQFWHHYGLFVFRTDFEENLSDVEYWISDRVTLESRYAEGFIVSNFLAAIHTPSLVSLRSVCVDEVSFRTAYHADQHERFDRLQAHAEHAQKQRK